MPFFTGSRLRLPLKKVWLPAPWSPFNKFILPALALKRPGSLAPDPGSRFEWIFTGFSSKALLKTFTFKLKSIDNRQEHNKQTISKLIWYGKNIC